MFITQIVFCAFEKDSMTNITKVTKILNIYYILSNSIDFIKKYIKIVV